MAPDRVTRTARAGKLTPAAMVIPQRKGVGRSVLPQSKPSEKGWGGARSRGETAAGKRGRHRRHTHDSSVDRGREIGKRGGACGSARRSSRLRSELLGWPAPQAWPMGVPTRREQARRGDGGPAGRPLPWAAAWHSSRPRVRAGAGAPSGRGVRGPGPRDLMGGSAKPQRVWVTSGNPAWEWRRTNSF